MGFQNTYILETVIPTVGNEVMTNITLFLIIGTVVTAGYLLFKFLIRLYRKPVLEINLAPLAHPKWSDRQKIQDQVDSFVRNGFEAAGDYKCRGIPSLIISGFVRPTEQIAGVIYDHPTNGIWVDVYVQYTDGANLTVSNAPTGHELYHMPQQTKIYCRGSSIEELLAKVMSERRKTGRVTLTIDDFATHFENQYQKEMKWHIDRKGPTPLEVMQVAQTMGETLDSERLQHESQKIQKIWVSAKWKPNKKSRPYGAAMPEVFQRPDLFREKMEQQSTPIPRLNVPALPVYLGFTAALAYWCYYGYQYNEIHRPVSFTALMVFLFVFLVLFFIMMCFREFHRRVSMCPLLKRMADLRPGAFLVVTGSSPSLFYARDRWIGKVSFAEGSDSQDAFTRLDATSKHSMGALTVSRKNLLDKVIWGGGDKETIPLPKTDFSQKFTVSGRDPEFAEKMLDQGLANAVLRLAELGQPFVEMNRNTAVIQIDEDLSRPRKESELRKFLEEAEGIIEAVTPLMPE